MKNRKIQAGAKVNKLGHETGQEGNVQRLEANRSIRLGQERREKTGKRLTDIRRSKLGMPDGLLTQMAVNDLLVNHRDRQKYIGLLLVELLITGAAEGIFTQTLIADATEGAGSDIFDCTQQLLMQKLRGIITRSISDCLSNAKLNRS